MRQMRTLEEDIYRMNVQEAEEMLRVFAEDEPSVNFILSNLYSRVREEVINGGERYAYSR